jgi:hypothetical protein
MSQLQDLFDGSDSNCNEMPIIHIHLTLFFQYLKENGTGTGSYKCAKCSGTCTITLTLEQMVELGHIDKYGRLRPVVV